MDAEEGEEPGAEIEELTADLERLVVKPKKEKAEDDDDEVEAEEEVAPVEDEAEEEVAAIDDESIGDIDADIADDDLGEIGTEEVEEEPEED